MWILLPVTLLGLIGAAPVQAASLAALLLCEDGSACKDDVAYAKSVVGNEPPITPIDLFLVLDAGGWSDGGDQRERFEQALLTAEVALSRSRYGQLDAAVNEGLAALDRWPGTVSQASLFALYFYQGVARTATGKAGAAYSFRQAAAIGDGVQQNLPTEDVRFTRPWLDESRKILVGGRGWIEVEGDLTRTEVRVDGRPIREPDAKIALLPGTHRVTATRANGIRTWEVDVPVLAERTSRVQPEFTAEGDANWVRAQLGGAMDNLQALPEVTDILAVWCAQHGVDELQLLQMRVRAVEHPLAPVDMTPAPATRPGAADGERLDMGDGVPTTFADAVTQARADEERAPTDQRTLKIVYFDPRSRLFHADTVLPFVPDHPPEHFRIGGSVGYSSVLGHKHAGFDLGFLAKFGSFGVQFDLGVLRAESPYSLQPGWVDRQLYHVDLLARWAPLPGRVSPFAALGPELYVPVAVGGRLTLGVEGRFASTWVGMAGLTGSVSASKLDVPLGWGTSVGVARTY